MMKRCLFIALHVSLVLSILAISALASCSDNPSGKQGHQARAAIIDQLYLLEPDEEFINKAAQVLESNGLAVDVWQGRDITVEFYRELPQFGYKLILFRVHSGLLVTMISAHHVEPTKTTYLFTGETYATTKYVAEQLADRVSNALMNEEAPLVFAVNSEFIRRDLDGNFNGSAIIMMGCESHYLDDMASAFVERGASVYLGWDRLVSLDYVDNTTIDLINNLYIENMSVAQGVAKTMTELGYDPYFHSQIKYSPVESGAQTIRELLNLAH